MYAEGRKERDSLLLLGGIKRLVFRHIKSEKKQNLVSKMVSNMLLWYDPPNHLHRSHYFIYKERTKSCSLNIIADNDGAVTAIAVIATYSISSNNDEE